MHILHVFPIRSLIISFLFILGTIEIQLTADYYLQGYGLHPVVGTVLLFITSVLAIYLAKDL